MNEQEKLEKVNEVKQRQKNTTDTLEVGHGCTRRGGAVEGDKVVEGGWWWKLGLEGVKNVHGTVMSADLNTCWCA